MKTNHSISILSGLVPMLLVVFGLMPDTAHSQSGDGSPPDAIECIDLGASADLPEGRSRVKLRCVTSDGAPAGLILVKVNSGEEFAQLRAEENGTGASADLKSGECEIEWIVPFATAGPVHYYGGSLPRRGLHLVSGHAHEIRVTMSLKRLEFVRVEVHLTADGKPIAAERLYRSMAHCRGRIIPLIVAGPGLLVGTHEFRIGTPDVHPTVHIDVCGRGFADVTSDEPDPGAPDSTVRIEKETRMFRDVLRGRVVDEFDDPCANQKFKLAVRESLKDVNDVMVDVVTDENGRFAVSEVEFPVIIGVIPERGEWQFVPELPDRSWLQEEDREYVLVRRGARKTTLELDPSTASAIADALRREEVWLDILPTSRIAHRMRLDCAAEKRLIPERALELETTRRLVLGYLPTGTYRLTLVVPSRGTYSSSFVVEATGDTDVRLEGGSLENEPIEIGPRPRSGVIIDGDVPTTLALAIAGYVEEAGRDRHRSGAITRFAANEPIRLTTRRRDNRVVTLVRGRSEVEHLYRDGDDEPFEQHHERKARVHGRVVDGDGEPLAGIVVNLSSIKGGEGLGHSRSPNAVELGEARTDAQGRFELRGISPGVYLLSVAEMELSGEGRERTFLYSRSSLKIVEVTDAGDFRLDIGLDENGEPCGCGSRHLSPRLHHPGETPPSSPVDRDRK